jgi:hypothetical protein
MIAAVMPTFFCGQAAKMMLLILNGQAILFVCRQFHYTYIDDLARNGV